MNDRITTIIKKIILLVSFLSIYSTIAIGQETANWYFGSPNLNPNTGIRVDFSSGSPVVSNCNPISTEEGSSSISTAAGVPLFYTDGSTVWDAATNAVLPGGTGLGGNTSTTQSAIIMPKPGSSTQWLIFTSGVTGGGFKYYTVTGTTPTGPFSVSTGTTLVGAGVVGEGLFIIGSTKLGSTFWVIGRDLGSGGGVRAWDVTNTGVVNTTPVTSTLSGAGFSNTTYDQNIGTIKSNTCQNMLAFTYFNSVVDVTGFNTATGQVTATAQQFSVGTQSYGIEFSNNDQYLYATNLAGGAVYRYNIATSTATSIGTASGEIGQLQMAPDGKIYAARNTGNGAPSYLGIISNPDGGGTWTANGLLVSSPNCGSYNGWCYRGLPTFPKSLVVASPILSPGDAGYCVNTAVPVSYTFAGTDVSRTWSVTPATGWSYTTNNATSKNPTITFTAAGTYKVKVDIVDNCSRHYLDSMNITISAPRIPAGIIDCGTSNITLEATGTPTSDYPNYKWYDAATGGNVLGVGTPVALNYGSIASSPSAVWVEVTGSVTVTSSGTNKKIGPPSGVQTWPGRGTGSYSNTFTVLADVLTLKSFTATPQSAGGSFDVEIKNSSGTVVFFQSYTGAVVNTPYVINVNAALPKGTYTVTLKNSGSIVWGGGNWSGGGNGQINLPTSGGVGTYGMADFTYDYENFSTITSCTNRVEVDRKCLNVFPGDGTYCTGSDIPLSYTFEGTATSQSWSITPGVANTDWKYTSGVSTDPAPTIQFMVAGSYTVTVTVVSGGINYTKSMTFTVNSSLSVAGAVSCSSPNLVLDNPASDPNEPNYIWYANSVSASNIIGTGTPLSYPLSMGGTMPSQICIGLAGSTPVVSSATNKSIGSTIGAGIYQNTPYTSPAIDILANRITLKSIDIEFRVPTDVTTYTVTIKKGATTVYTTTNNGSTLPASGVYTMPINTTLLKGTGYTIVLTSSPSGLELWSSNQDNDLTNANEVTYYKQLPANGAKMAIGNLKYDAYNYTITAVCVTPTCIPVGCSLPITLLQFTGTSEGSKNVLNWTTASEMNNSYFDIQRSADGIHFISIGKIEGHGTTNTINEYQFVDMSPASGINYYKLVQSDYDGKQSPSKVIEISTGLTNASSFIVTPNPSTEIFTIRFTELEAGEFTVLDVLGKVVLTKSIESGTEKIELGAEFAKGAYIARFISRTGSFTQLIIKE